MALRTHKFKPGDKALWGKFSTLVTILPRERSTPLRKTKVRNEYGYVDEIATRELRPVSGQEN